MPSRIAAIIASSPLANVASSAFRDACVASARSSASRADTRSSVWGHSACAVCTRCAMSRDSASTRVASRSTASRRARTAASAAPGKDQNQLLVPTLSMCTSESSTRLCTTSFTAWNTTPFFAAAFSMSFRSHGSALSWKSFRTVMRLSCAGVRSRGSGRRDWRREGRNAETQTVSEARTPARNLTRRASHAFRNASRESGHPSLKARSREHVPPRTCLEAACRSIPPSNARVFSRPADARDDAVGSIHPARATSGRAPRTVRWLLKSAFSSATASRT